MLTDTAIRKAKPAASPLKLSDGGGMYLLVKPDGGKYWRMNYRFDGKQKTLSFGVYPTVTLADARQRREDARRLLANDSDPGEVRKVMKAERIEAAITAADTFESVTREWMARQEVAEITKGKNEWILGHLFPSIGKRPIADKLGEIGERARQAGVTAKWQQETLRQLRFICGLQFEVIAWNGRDRDRKPLWLHQEEGRLTRELRGMQKRLDRARKESGDGSTQQAGWLADHAELIAAVEGGTG